MLIAPPRGTSTGFTLVELMLTIVVLSILVGVGMPSFVQLMRNAEIRAAGEAVTNGLQKARAEAVSRNTDVQFVLGTGSSWTVSVVTPASTIESRTSSEGSAHVTVTAVAADLATAATTATFNNLGGVKAANADGSLPLSRVTLNSTGANQQLRVEIGAGGSTRLCVPPPYLALGSSPRACNTL
jgi:type IV fimbrial biogenesis protein FimT